MNWITAHPYAAAVTIAILLIVFGSLIVEEHSLVPATQATNSWKLDTLIDNPNAQPRESPQAIVQQVIRASGPATLQLPPLSFANPNAGSTPAPANAPFDYVGLLNQIEASSSVHVSSQNNGQSPQNILGQAYKYIPQGLVATTTVVKKPMTASQKALYDYGNTLGVIIQSFETQQKNEAQVLKDQVEDRTDPGKAAAVVMIGKALANVGTQIGTIDPSTVPASVASLNTALARSYKDIGAKLQLVPAAQSDADYVAAIKSYDAAADVFVRNYAALAQYFSIAGVSFSSGDPGSVFSFTNTSGGSL